MSMSAENNSEFDDTIKNYIKPHFVAWSLLFVAGPSNVSLAWSNCA